MHLQVGEVNLQFDTGPNFLDQIDRHRIEKIDAVIYTHCHADHISGTNDLVMPCRKQKMDMPIYGPEETMGVLQKNYDYMFSKGTYQGGGVAHLLPHSVSGRFVVEGVELECVPVQHGAVVTFGYRIGKLGYVSDVKRFLEGSLDLLKGVDILVLDALSFNPKHPTHLSVGEAVEATLQIGPKRTYLTHMMHRIDDRFFAEQCEENGVDLPDDVQLAYDGQVLEV
jgi:phosphoribosyl 1,2-cyclic phosphate phosphodiesterase